MADKKTETTTTKAAADEPAEETPAPGTTVPGGHYINADGMHVDAEGRELTKAGKLKNPEE